MDRLPEVTLNFARETSSEKVKLVLSPRNELNNPAQQRERQRKTGTLAEEDFTLKEKKEIRARLPAPKKRPQWKKPHAVFSRRHTWCEDFSHEH